MKRDFMSINTTNNAKSTLAWDLNIWDKFFYCYVWEWGIFPENNFFVTFEEKNERKEIIKRMVCKISSREWDKFYISEYSAEYCVQNDTEKPKIYSKNNLNFQSWSDISLYFTALQFDNFLQSSNNLSDLKNIEIARQNLWVLNEKETETKILNKIDEIWFVTLDWNEEITWVKTFNWWIVIPNNTGWESMITLWKTWTWKSSIVADIDGIKFRVLEWNNRFIFRDKNNKPLFHIWETWVFVEAPQSNNGNSLTKKSYVDLKISQEITKYLQAKSGRPPRIDLILYGN